MKKFKVRVNYTAYKEVEVYAKNEGEAKNIAFDNVCKLPATDFTFSHNGRDKDKAEEIVLPVEEWSAMLADKLKEGEGYVEFDYPISTTVIKENKAKEFQVPIDSVNIEDDHLVFWSKGRDFLSKNFAERYLRSLISCALDTINQQSKPKTLTNVEAYKGMKKKHDDAIILMRVGDFYETYMQDAEDISKILGVTLTKRKDGTALAGFPYHALDSYLPKIIRAGRRVAICDAIERTVTDPVKKRITETV